MLCPFQKSKTKSIPAPTDANTMISYSVSFYPDYKFRRTSHLWMISVTPQTLLKFAVRTCQPVSQPLNLICSTYSISPFKDMIQPRLQRLSGGSVLNSLFTFDHNPIMHTRNVFLLPETCRMKTEVTAYLYKSFR